MMSEIWDGAAGTFMATGVTGRRHPFALLLIVRCERAMA
jgi:hypothetical protein